MSRHCSTVEQGYPTLRTMHDCALSHTGLDLWPLMLLGFMLLVAGAFIIAATARRSS